MGGYVRRPRLTDAILGQAATVFEAGAGYGKSALAAEVAARLEVSAVVAALEARDDSATMLTTRLRRALARAGLSDLRTAIERSNDPAESMDDLLDALAMLSEPVLLVIDDSHHLRSEDAVALLVRLATQVTEPHRVVVIARELPSTARKLRRTHGVGVLDGKDLAFTVEEVHAVFESHGIDLEASDAKRVHAATDGWPAAVVLLASRALRTGDPSTVMEEAERTTTVGDLVRLIVDDLPSQLRDPAIQIAHLPILTHDVVAAASGKREMWDALLDSGIPLTQAGEGRWVLPGSVRESMTAGSSLDPIVARRAADVYTATGELRAAFDVLMVAGDFDGVAMTLADLSRRAFEPMTYAEIAAIVDVLPVEIVNRHPRVLLLFARVAMRADRFTHRFVALERLEEILSRQDDPDLRNETDLEIARDLIRLFRTDDAMARIAHLTAALRPEHTLARVLLFDVLGQHACRNAAYLDGENYFIEAKRLALQAGDRVHAGMMASRLATSSYYESGRMTEAVAAMRESIALANAPTQRVLRLNFLADFLTELGRYPEAHATLDEQERLAVSLRDERAIAYVYWARARIASQLGDVRATVRSLQEVEAHTGEWFDQTAAYFLADGADLLDRVGETAKARAYLARALEISDLDPIPMIAAIIEGRSGDPQVAETKLEPSLDDFRWPYESWRLRLIRAFAALRRYDERAGVFAAEAFDAAAAIGMPDAPFIKERVVAEQLVALAAASGSTSASAALGEALPVTLSLLGRFGVTRGGAAVEISAGKPTQALKVVGCRGGQVTVDVLIEDLWPEIEPDVGRRRLRNVLARTKVGDTELLVREADVVRFATTVTVDAAVFERDARLALDAPGGIEQASFARTALLSYTGELLPNDPYEPWTATPRERLRRLRLSLVDLVAADAESLGELDEAVRVLFDGIDADPYDEVRYVLAARLLASQGRLGPARGLLDRGRERLAELGLEPTTAFRQLEVTL